MLTRGPAMSWRLIQRCPLPSPICSSGTFVNTDMTPETGSTFGHVGSASCPQSLLNVFKFVGVWSGGVCVTTSFFFFTSCADLVSVNALKICRVAPLTSGGWTDEIGNAMEEIHHAQCQRQVLSSHQVRCHHGDQGYIGPVKVTVENSEGHEEQEGLQQWHKEAAEAFHHHREDVTCQTVGLQTPKGAQREHYRQGNRLHWYVSLIGFVQRSAMGIK